MNHIFPVPGRSWRPWPLDSKVLTFTSGNRKFSPPSGLAVFGLLLQADIRVLTGVAAVVRTSLLGRGNAVAQDNHSRLRIKRDQVSRNPKTPDQNGGEQLYRSRSARRLIGISSLLVGCLFVSVRVLS